MQTHPYYNLLHANFNYDEKACLSVIFENLINIVFFKVFDFSCEDQIFAMRHFVYRTN